MYLLLQADKLSLAFITGKSDSVMLRVDSAQSDYLQIALVKYKFFKTRLSIEGSVCPTKYAKSAKKTWQDKSERVLKYKDEELSALDNLPLKGRTEIATPWAPDGAKKCSLY